MQETVISSVLSHSLVVADDVAGLASSLTELLLQVRVEP